jgi:hypothetical protein
LDNAPELLRLFVQALALFATSLDRWFRIPWPLPIAVLFLPVLAVLYVIVWYLRGMTFPISCGYIKVGEKGRCSRPALGEWHKCRYHSKRRLRKTDRHLVDPDMRRWQARLHEANPTEAAVTGRGFLSMHSHRDTLLYHHGFARPPQDVFKIIPPVLHDYKSLVVERWTNLKSLGLRGLIPVTDKGSRQVTTSHVLPGVIHATRLTLVIVALGLGLVGVSIVVPSVISVILEYGATFLFVIALAITRAGIWRAEQKWLRLASGEALKWIAWFTFFATASGLIGLYAGGVKDFADKIAEVIFNALILLFAICLGYIVFFRKRTGRSKRKWKL